MGIVLLGFQLGVQEVAGLGAAGLTFVLTVVAATFFGTRWLGARLGVIRPLSLLVASGFLICGASAISAVAGVVEADEDDVACSIALVTLCGSLAIGLLPLLAGPLGLHGRGVGTWVGASVHDVAQVVAAASLDGQIAVQVAVVVKLSRVILLAPLVAALSLGRRLTNSPRESSASEPSFRRPPVMPVLVTGVRLLGI
ncbi:MAG: YeiH family protein [Acidimicrobiia bacterium]